jgi:hypothetical protein
MHTAAKDDVRLRHNSRNTARISGMDLT